MERRREAIICNYCLHQVCSCSLILIHFRLLQLKKIKKYRNKGMVLFLEGQTGRQIKSINQTDTRLRWFSLFCFIKAVAWKQVGRINPDTFSSCDSCMLEEEKVPPPAPPGFYAVRPLHTLVCCDSYLSGAHCRICNLHLFTQKKQSATLCQCHMLPMVDF